jgi:CheY-like chemotaxis protein
MSQNSAIILVDDDSDDHLMLQDALREIDLEDKLIHFDSTEKALAFIAESTENPFLILCDINMPGSGGIDFKTQIDKDPVLRNKSIPFVF